MTLLVVETSEGVSLRLRVAGAGSRLAAGLLDGILIALVVLFAALALAALSAFDSQTASGFLLGLLVGGLLLLLVGYHVAFHALWNGQTPGKRALGLRVASADGRPATFLQVVVRGLVQPIDALLWMPVALGLVVIAITPRHQRLGDLAAGTLVLRDEDPVVAQDPFPNERWGSAPRSIQPAPELVARLTEDERAFLHALLTRRGLEPEAHRVLYVEAARHFAARLGLGEFADARVVLRDLYLYVRESRDGRVPESPFSRARAAAPGTTSSDVAATAANAMPASSPPEPIPGEPARTPDPSEPPGSPAAPPGSPAAPPSPPALPPQA